MNNKTGFFFFFLIFMLSPCFLFAEANVLLRAGVEHFTWSPWTHIALKSSAVIDTQPYQLYSYRFDFSYNNSKLLNIDYYQPVNSETKGSFYVNELEKICFTPLLFLLTSKEQPYPLRFLLTAEFTRDNKKFSTSIKTKSNLTYNTLNGDSVVLNNQSPGVSTTSKFRTTDITFDLFGGYFKNEVISKDDLSGFGIFLIPFLKNAEFRIGYLESDFLQPIGEKAFLDESQIDVRGFTFGLRSRDRVSPGFNVNIFSAYGEGDVVSPSSKYKVTHNYKFADVWYNHYYVHKKINFLFTLGSFTEWIDIRKQKAQIRTDTLKTIYFQTGVCF